MTPIPSSRQLDERLWELHPNMRAMRFQRRSGLLRTTPIFVVVAVPEPAAIARSAS